MMRDRGFVLLNALVIVAAMAAAAALVLSRVEVGTARLSTTRDAAQLVAYLDAFEAQAQTVLARDVPSFDHPAEPWAAPVASFTLDRGEVSGHITDLQGRFNLNWLAGPEPELARAALDRLLLRIGARSGIADALADALSIAPERNSAYLGMDPPRTAVGGPLAAWDQLRGVPGLTAGDIARLAPHAAVLPVDSALNLNTTTQIVLAAVLPEADTGALLVLLDGRDLQHFTALEETLEQLSALTGSDVTEGPFAFSLASDWFDVQIEARLGSRGAVRRITLERDRPLPQIRFRVTEMR